MAFFPCSNHHGPYKGPSSAVYPVIVAGAEAKRNKLRMCTGCFDDYVLNTAVVLSEINEAGDYNPGFCYRCSETQELQSIFVTVYPRGSEPRAFYGRVCPEHRNGAIAEFLLQ